MYRSIRGATRGIRQARAGAGGGVENFGKSSQLRTQGIECFRHRRSRREVAPRRATVRAQGKTRIEHSALRAFGARAQLAQTAFLFHVLGDGVATEVAQLMTR